MSTLTAARAENKPQTPVQRHSALCIAGLAVFSMAIAVGAQILITRLTGDSTSWPVVIAFLVLAGLILWLIPNGLKKFDDAATVVDPKAIRHDFVPPPLDPSDKSWQQ